MELPEPDGTAEANKEPHPEGGYTFDEIPAWSEPLVRAAIAAAVAAERERCIDARNKLNAALHGEGAVIDSLEHAVANAVAEIVEWRKLRDPVTLHVNLLRGFPARLDRDTLLHLAGDEAPPTGSAA